MRFIKIAIGNALVSFAYACITIPKVILNGGITSFSLIFSDFTGVSLSFMVNFMTFLLLLLSLTYLGASYFIGILFSSLCYIAFFNAIYFFKYEVALAYYFALPLASLLVALGYYFCLSAKSSAVSFDTLALILNKKHSGFDVAITTMVINILVLLMGVFVFSLKAIVLGLCFTILQGLFLKVFVKKF